LIPQMAMMHTLQLSYYTLVGPHLPVDSNVTLDMTSFAQHI